jgi:hypothetical protein
VIEEPSDLPLGGTVRFSKRKKHKAAEKRGNRFRPPSERTVELSAQAAAVIRERGSVTKYMLATLLGVKRNNMNSLLIHITAVYPDVAEADDGKLIWVGGENGKNTKINWRPFKQLAEMRGKGAISREHFIANWRVVQRDQGIRADGKGK